MNRFLVLFALVLLPISMGFAEVYKWVDDNGRIHYGDSPPQKANAKKLDIKINSFKVVTFGENNLSPSIQGENKNNRSKNYSKTVVMYSTIWCGYCKQAAKYFKTNNIPFREYDVENTSKGKRDYKKLNGKGVPIILVGKRRMNGFNVGSFERFYGI